MEKVLIVGGRSGLGKSIAEDLKVDYVIETLSRTKSDSNEFTHHIVNAITPDALRVYFQSHDPYDHLIITAADTLVGGIKNLTDEQTRHTIDNKLLLSYLSARDIPWKKSLTFFSGYFSVRPGPASSLLTAINASIEGLTRGLAIEFAPARVNCISPGTIDGGHWERTDADVRHKVMEGASRRSLLGKPGTPKDVVKAVRFSMECEYLTAEVIYVDGGSRIGIA